ncbi:hypothetical protein KIN20_003520 [Parelaphostrongylus tenuis]|uniref:Uncharacterized protein n=1 Tax=Parelaphostrongylus tenuis TaxID=148309 RepID=A0AAD5MFT0_PARTN|nr:hypothetical protein KIN20_003520 [Parelaphostrongylus tenuis]
MKSLLFISLISISTASCSFPVPKARALMLLAVPGGNPTTVIGEINMTEYNGVVSIIGNLTRLTPGLHGIPRSSVWRSQQWMLGGRNAL